MKRKINAYLSAICFDESKHDTTPILCIKVEDNTNDINKLYEKYNLIGVKGIEWNQWRIMLDFPSNCFNANEHELYGNDSDLKKCDLSIQLYVLDTKTGSYHLSYTIGGDHYELDVFVCVFNDVGKINEFLNCFNIENNLVSHWK